MTDLFVRKTLKSKSSDNMLLVRLCVMFLKAQFEKLNINVLFPHLYIFIYRYQWKEYVLKFICIPTKILNVLSEGI